MRRIIIGMAATLGILAMLSSGSSTAFAQEIVVTIQENPSPPFDTCPANNRELQVLLSGTGLSPTDTLAAATVDIQYDTLTWSFNSAHHDLEFAEEYTSLNTTAYDVALSEIPGGIVRSTVLPNQNLAAIKALGQPLSGTPLVAINHMCFNPVAADAASRAAATGDDAIVDLGTLVVIVFAPVELPTGSPGFLECNGEGTGDFPCVVNDLQGALPVEFSSLNALAGEEGITLTWTTESETNNAGFSIEHAVGENSEFAELAFVEGQGSTLEPQSYSYKVTGLDVGHHKFRLRQIDFDGAFEYSEIIEAVIELAGTHRLGAAYPNPFNPSTRFELVVGRDQRVRVDIINALGQRVMRLYDGVMEANEPRNFVFDAGTLPTGLYFYKVVGENFVQTRQMLLVK